MRLGVEMRTLFTAPFGDDQRVSWLGPDLSLHEAADRKIWYRYLRARKKEKNASCNKIKGFHIFSRLLMRSTSGPYSWLQLLLNSPHMLPELFRNRFCHSVFINVFMFLTKWKQNRAKISQNLCECVSLSVCVFDSYSHLSLNVNYMAQFLFMFIKFHICQ